MNALNDLGIKQQVLDLLSHPPVINIDQVIGKRGDNWSYSIGDEPAADYFGESAMGTVREFFDSLHVDALTYRPYGYGGVRGVYYSENKYDVKSDTCLLLHEVTHYVYPLAYKTGADLDLILINDLDLTFKKGERPTDIVSRFFNSPNHCDPKLRNLRSSITASENMELLISPVLTLFIGASAVAGQKPSEKYSGSRHCIRDLCFTQLDEYGWENSATKHVEVLIADKSLSKANLSIIFAYLSKHSEPSKRLIAVVHTSKEDLTDSQTAGLSEVGAAEKFKHRKAYHYRGKDLEYFRYTPFQNVAKYRMVVLRGELSRSK